MEGTLKLLMIYDWPRMGHYLDTEHWFFTEYIQWQKAMITI